MFFWVPWHEKKSFSELDVEEAIIVTFSVSESNFKLASNCSYEIWMDDIFTGLGGHRCPPGKVYWDRWIVPEKKKMTTSTSTCIRLRIHWLNPEKNSVWHRMIFRESFLVLDDQDLNVIPYGFKDTSIQFSPHKMSSQLPHQTLCFPSLSTQKCKGELLSFVSLKEHWIVEDFPVGMVPLQPKPCLKLWDLDLNLDCNLVLREKSKNQAHRKLWTPLKPNFSRDLIGQILIDCSVPLFCQTVDLGEMGLYSVEIENQSLSPMVLAYSQTGDFNRAWLTPNHKKVKLADAVAPGAHLVLLGQRGCKYIHLISDKKTNFNQIQLQAWKWIYPFHWKIPSETILKDSDLLILWNACKKTLEAICDLGLVDTCWRERAQWTGDARMACKAIRRLTDPISVTTTTTTTTATTGSGNAIVHHVLHQIAESYHEKVAMVEGCYPTKKSLQPNGFVLPTYHLSFCLACIEHWKANPTWDCSRLRSIVQHTLTHWKKYYVNQGLLYCPEGWNFVDWDFSDMNTFKQQQKNQVQSNLHAIIHAWWQQLCQWMGISSGLDPLKVHTTFETKTGYSIYPKNKNSPHAVACFLTNGFVPRVRIPSLLQTLQPESLRSRVTPYFVFFVAEALSTHGISPLPFLKKFLIPRIQSCEGTIPEKCTDGASLAHGWSIGIAEFL